MSDYPEMPARARFWRQALRALHDLGWTDSRIADALTDLDDNAIAAIAAAGWKTSRVESAFRPLAGGRIWSRQMVGYYRRQLGLSSRAARPEFCPPRRVLFAYGSGWGHLLESGYDLRPMECRILGVLEDRGPMTRPEIQLALGKPCRAKWQFHGRSWLGRLLRPASGLPGLIERGPWRRVFGSAWPVYSLAPWVGPCRRRLIPL